MSPIQAIQHLRSEAGEELQEQIPATLWEQEPAETLRALMDASADQGQERSNQEHLQAVAAANSPQEGAAAVLAWINDRTEARRKLSQPGPDEPN